MNKYQLINGYILMNNSELYIKYSLKKYFYLFFKMIGSIAVLSSFVKKYNNYENIIGVYENIKFWIFGMASVYLVYLFFEFIFKSMWFSEIAIHEIIKMQIENDEDEKEIDEDSKIEITLIKNNGRRKIIELQKQKNQLQQFIEEIKKRNSRIKIEYL
tara:strand:+ start:15324 stop:15797 length:474 start_codon:yes stop_codon:yes gene_type:complete